MVDSPVTFALAVATQENVLPEIDDVKFTPVARPEHIVCGFGVAVATGAVQEHEGEAIFVSI